MRTVSFAKRRQLVLKERALDYIHYKAVIGLMLCFGFYLYFFREEMIGYDPRFSILTWWLPVLAGLLLLLLYRRDFLAYKLKWAGNPFFQAYIGIIYLIQGIFYSYISLGLLVNVSWTCINKYIGAGHPVVLIERPVERFWANNIPSIDFYYENNFESIRVSHSTIKLYKGKDPKQFLIRLKVKQGLWNYYFVKEWELIKQEKRQGL